MSLSRRQPSGVDGFRAFEEVIESGRSAEEIQILGFV